MISTDSSLTDPDGMGETATYETENIQRLNSIEDLKVENKQKENIRVAVIGNVDSGKSTLTAVLACGNGTTDDGRGALREKVFNFTHEKENGRTSSIGHEIIGFDANGNQVIPKKKDIFSSKKKVVWPEIVEGS